VQQNRSTIGAAGGTVATTIAAVHIGIITGTPGTTRMVRASTSFSVDIATVTGATVTVIGDKKNLGIFGSLSARPWEALPVAARPPMERRVSSAVCISHRLKCSMPRLSADDFTRPIQEKEATLCAASMHYLLFLANDCQLLFRFLACDVGFITDHYDGLLRGPFLHNSAFLVGSAHDEEFLRDSSAGEPKQQQPGECISGHKSSCVSQLHRESAEDA
jgi:hypothetical protein